VFDSVCAM